MAAAITALPEVDEVEQSSMVGAVSGRTPIYSLAKAGDTEPTRIGSIIYRDYEENRDIRGAWFENNAGRLGPLGSATHQFRMIDHYSVVKPLLDAGFEARSVQHHRGGASFMGFFAHPDISFEDPISWDSWAGKATTRSMELSLRVRADLRRGRGISMSLGYFRLICTNGLVANVFDMGGLRLDHRNFQPAKVQEFLDMKITPDLRASLDPRTLITAPSSTLGPVIDILEFDELDKVLALPRLLRTPAASVHKALSATVRSSLAEDLSLLKDSKADFTKLDLVNSLTNQAHNTRSQWGIYDEADPVTSALVDLVELSGVKAGLRTFE